MKIREMFNMKISDKCFSGKLKQILATVCLGPISLGTSYGWTSPVLPQLIENNSTNSIHLTFNDGSWIGSMIAIGVLLTAIPFGYLIERIGPKICTLLLLIPMLTFTIIVIFLKDVYSLCVARFLSGVSSGGIALLGLMYVSEIADVKLRGTLGSLFELLTHCGGLFVSLSGTYLHYVTLTSVIGVVNLVLGLMFIYLPDSPIHLMKIKKQDKARAALHFYRSPNYNVEIELNEIHSRLNHEQKKRNKWEAIKSKPVIRGLIATVGLKVFQQLSGLDGLDFYLVQIFQSADTNIDHYMSANLVLFVHLISAALVLFVIEKAGRKFFLYASAIVMAICLTSVGLYFHLKKHNIDFPGARFIPVTGLVLHAFGYAMGLGPIPWVIDGELFPPDIKEMGNGITMTVDLLFLFLVTKMTPVVMKEYGIEYTFYFFAICMVICCLFVKFCLIETKGKSLHEIQLELMR